jgi:Siphovirus ReqiPepy6 Gp37-like protein
MTGEWSLFLTDQLGVRVGAVDVYDRCEIIARTNDVSNWTLNLPSDTKAGALLLAGGKQRLEIRFEEQAWRSGPVSHIKRTVDADGDHLEIAGEDDTVWLARRLAHPQPTTTAPPYNSNAYRFYYDEVPVVLALMARDNVTTGTIPPRQVPGVTVTVPPHLGTLPIVYANARWQNLLTLMQDTARGSGFVFDITNLTWHCAAAVNRGAVFSMELETLGAWTVTTQSPVANYVYVGGGGEGTARVVREDDTLASVTVWGRAEQFVDRRDTTDVAQLDQAVQDALALGVTPTTVVFSPLDTPGQSFGHQWFLGDIVTVQAGTLTVTDQIREVHVLLDGYIPTITPSVGAPSGDIGLFRALAGLDRRVRQLERV